MRFKVAIPLVVAGVLVMLLGIGQLTFWAPPETVTATVPAGTRGGPVTVIDAAARNSDSEDVEITVRAEGSFTVAVGRAGDVDAWVGDAAHLRITGAQEDRLQSTFTDGEDAVPNPSGADLWTSEETADGSVSLRWLDPAEGEWSILLAADGTGPAPTDVSITWPNDQSTPWAVPLIIAGALLTVLGIALTFVSPRGGKTAGGAAEGSRAYLRKQQTARRSPGRRRTATFAALDPGAGRAMIAGVLGIGLSAAGLGVAQATTAAPAPSVPATTAQATTPAPPASPESASSESASSVPAPGATPETQASEPPAEQYPVVLANQLERILEKVAASVSEADAASDAELLDARVAGSALTLRNANYSVRSEAGDVPAPTPVAPAPVLSSMISTDASWPRTVVALTQGDDNPVPHALVLVQEDPRANYKLTSAVQMLPGTTFPAAPPGGVPEVPLDEPGGLKLSPQDAMNAIADFLTKPTGDNSKTFEENSFADAITSFQADVVADPDNKSAEITFTREVVPENTYALSTGDGGAMVFGYLSHTYSSVPRDAGDSINLDKTIYETLTGETSTTEGIDVRYGEAVMMYVPPAGSDEMVRMIGAAQQLLSADLR